MQGKVIIGAELDTKNFEEQIKETESYLEKLEKSYEKALNPKKGFVKDEEALKKLRVEIEKTSNKLVDLKKRQSDLNKIDFSSMNKKITGIIRKIGKWSLAIFGIRSAYMAVRNAINTISQDDEQLKADIDYIKNVIAYALEPVVRKIVELVKYLLTFVGYLVQKWFKYDIFANANKNLKKSVGSAKELRKTLAGFDEMNVLNADGSVGVGGGVLPSFDGNYDKIEQQITRIKDKIKETHEELENALYKTDFSIWTTAFGKWDLAVYGVSQTINGLWRMVEGLFGTVKGIWQTIYGIITGDTKKAHDGFSLLISSVGKMIKGAFEIATGLLNTFKGIYKAVIQTLMGWLFDFINKGIDKFNNFRDKVTNVWINIGNKIKNVVQSIQNWLTQKFGAMGTAIGNVIGASFKLVINSVLGAIERMLNYPINSINSLINKINNVPGINLGKLSTFKFPRLAQGGIVNNPGNGVFMGGYVAGERGAEAVLPLTDEVFDRLGMAIGKHTSINATIPVYAYNRQVAKEIRKIEAEQSFAYNR